MKSPAFSFYVRDWLCSNTVSKLHSKAYGKTDSKLYSRGVGAYVFLLCQAWLQEPQATLPSDDGELADLARVTTEEWDAIKTIILPSLKVGTDGRLFSERQMHEALKQQMRSKAGSKGGSKLQAKRIAALEDENEDENEITPELIYAAYPLKVGKPAALRAISKAMEKIEPVKLLELTKSYFTKRNGDMSFVPHPSTWFNQERFNDDPSTWIKNEHHQNGSKPNPRNTGMGETAESKSASTVALLARRAAASKSEHEDAP